MPTTFPTFTAPMLAALPVLPDKLEHGTFFVTRTSVDDFYSELEEAPVDTLDLTNSEVQWALTNPPCRGAELKLFQDHERFTWVVWVIHNVKGVNELFEWYKTICEGHFDEIIIIKHYPHDEEIPYIELYDDNRE